MASSASLVILRLKDGLLCLENRHPEVRVGMLAQRQGHYDAS